MISVRAAFACGTTPGMLRKACVAPGCSISADGRPGLPQPLGVGAAVIGHRVERRDDDEGRCQSVQVVELERRHREAVRSRWNREPSEQLDL